MKPKEKAKELVDKMYSQTPVRGTISEIEIDYQYSKQCALIAIEFAREFITGDLSESFDKTMYLFEVKKEIEKL